MQTALDDVTTSVKVIMVPEDQRIRKECDTLAAEIEAEASKYDDVTDGIRVPIEDPETVVQTLRQVRVRLHHLYTVITILMARGLGASLQTLVDEVQSELNHKPEPKPEPLEPSPEFLDALNKIFGADEDDEVRFNITDKGYPYQNDVRLFKQNEVEPMAAAALLFSKDFPSVLRGGILRYIQDWIRLRPGKPEITVQISNPNEGQETAGPPEAETVDTSEKV